MPVRRGARGELRLPRGWTALCLLSLLPSGFTNPTNNLTSVAMESSTLGIVSSVSTNVLNQDQDSTTPSGPASTSPHPIPQDSNETTSAISETMVNFTATSGVSPGPETTNSSAKSQTTFSALTVITTADNISTSEMAWMPSTTLVNFSYYSPNSTIPEMTSATESYTFTSSSPVPSTIKGEIKCSGIREMRLAQGICLELSEASSCEEFKKGKGEGLTQILCGKEKANGEVEAGVCSLLLAQSEVKPECLLLLLVNKTELFSKLQLMETHQSDLRKGEDPYYTDHSGGQGYSSGSGASRETQGKTSVTQGAQENGTGQTTSRNGHSARQHVMADTEL
uniref:hematopoietic progenitor cell antigen CD34 isoform X2 n=1 Tax=Jaculus jaculus TaxID=51337 RepID=UPI001E1B2338|nr:hematopoietic progenitor cell antigen CD34 isoform X2 [Jaculus jaculus]